jgi:hypothetical protein
MRMKLITCLQTKVKEPNSYLVLTTLLPLLYSFTLLISQCHFGFDFDAIKHIMWGNVMHKNRFYCILYVNISTSFVSITSVLWVYEKVSWIFFAHDLIYFVSNAATPVRNYCASRFRVLKTISTAITLAV